MRSSNGPWSLVLGHWSFSDAVRFIAASASVASCHAEAASAAVSARHEREPLEEMHVLFVLQERTVQWRNQFFRVALAQGVGADILDHQKLQPVEQFGSGGLFLHAWHFADFVEQLERLRYQPLLDARKMHVDNGTHRVRIRKPYVVKEAAAQKR